MRLVLREGMREVVVFDRRRFMQFTDLHQAATYLVDYITDRGNLETLRGLLAEHTAYEPDGQDPTEIVAEVAHMILQGRLNVLVDPESLPPWMWQFPETPTFPGDDGGAEAESEPLTAEETETSEDEDESTDAKPEPVIPPVYIALALAESEAVEYNTKLYKSMLMVLAFVGQDDNEKSEVAESLKEHADSQGGQVQEAAGGLSGMLAALLGSSENPLASSAVKDKLRDTALEQGEAIRALSTEVGEANTGVRLPIPTGENWIRFRVIDDETEAPVPNASFVLRTSEGKFRKLISDEDGVCTEKQLPDGAADVAMAWGEENLYEVVKVEEEDGSA